MADNKNSVRLENKRFNGLTGDPYVGADGTFQYSENINVRNNLKGFELSSREESRVPVFGINCYLVYSPGVDQPPVLLKFYQNGSVTTSNNNWLTETTVFSLGTPATAAFSFKGFIYAFGNNKVYQINPTGWVVNDITGALTGFNGAYRTFGLNYWNNTLVIGNGNNLYTLGPDPTVGTPVFPTNYIWQRRRQFSQGNEIVGISNSGGNIKVYTTYQYTDSRVFYIPASFDIGYEGINNTIEWGGMNIRNIGIIGKTDYVISRGSGIDTVGVTNWKFYQTSGYDRQTVMQTNDGNGNSNYITQFLFNDLNQSYVAYGDIVYMPGLDGIRSYGKSTPGINDSLTKEWSYTNRTPISSVVFGDYLYVSFQDGASYTEKRYYLGYRYPSYTTNQGILISRVYNANFFKDVKQTIEISVGYELEPQASNPGSIQVYIRPNRINKNIISGWKLIGTITDKTKNKFRAIASQITQDFNMLEYKIVLIPGDATVSPAFNELYLEYNTTGL